MSVLFFYLGSLELLNSCKKNVKISRFDAQKPYKNCTLLKKQKVISKSVSLAFLFRTSTTIQIHEKTTSKSNHKIVCSCSNKTFPKIANIENLECQH